MNMNNKDETGFDHETGLIVDEAKFRQWQQRTRNVPTIIQTIPLGEVLRKGRFYSSAGPEIHSLELDDGVLTVRCSPVASATLVAGPRRGARVNAGRLGYPHAAEILDRDAAGAITAARLERPWGAEYGRLELADASGRKAWTNPVWP